MEIVKLFVHSFRAMEMLYLPELKLQSRPNVVIVIKRVEARILKKNILRIIEKLLALYQVQRVQVLLNSLGDIAHEQTLYLIKIAEHKIFLLPRRANSRS